jgi:hypothetical protein
VTRVKTEEKRREHSRNVGTGSPDLEVHVIMQKCVSEHKEGMLLHESVGRLEVGALCDFAEKEEGRCMGSVTQRVQKRTELTRV